jgi:hypothetical protein
MEYKKYVKQAERVSLSLKMTRKISFSKHKNHRYVAIKRLKKQNILRGPLKREKSAKKAVAFSRIMLHQINL